VPHPLVQKILEDLNADVLRKLELTKRIENPGESGRARENIIRDFVGRLLPGTLGLGTGFVIDAVGGKSRQIDIVVYRADYHPVFEIGQIKHFLVESVLAVIENKSAISSRADLASALENIRSVKALDRTNRGRNYRVVGTTPGPKVNPDNFADQVFGAIVTAQSLALATLEEELLAFLRKTSRREWPNFYADVHGVSAFYGIEREGGRVSGADPNDAVALCVTHRDVNTEAPLIEFGSELANFVRVATLVDFSPVDYLFRVRGANRATRI
jgi:uncharacterized protein DUF6602